MTNVRKADHVHLRVQSLEESVQFYEQIFGLREKQRDAGVVYLENIPENHYHRINDGFELAVEKGEPGLDHVGYRVTDEVLDKAIEGLSAEGHPHDETNGSEPGQERGVSFTLPGGASIELTVVEKQSDVSLDDSAYPQTHHTPNGLDHVTLSTDAVQKDGEFLRDTLGFKISEVMMAGPDRWGAAFTRLGAHHHDLGLLDADMTGHVGLDHIAWEMRNMTHMKQFMDFFGRYGGTVDMNFTRHPIGNNIAVYMLDPSNFVHEIAIELQTLDEDTPTLFHEGDPNRLLSDWPGTFPEVGGEE